MADNRPTSKDISGQFSAIYRTGSSKVVGSEEDKDAAVNRQRRARLQRQASGIGSGQHGSGDLRFATGRPRDPMFYWRQNNMPYDFDEPEQLTKLRAYCRLLYQTHPIIGSCIDIYSKFPLTGMDVTSKNDQINDFYRDLFFNDEGLNYNEFLVDFGREYWSVGEVFPLGTFNEELGIWEDEELMHPDDVEVKQSPFLREPRYFIKLPHNLREIISNREPAWEYQQLMQAYPEMAQYASEPDKMMPVSNILLRHYRFKGDTHSPRGVPLLMRAFRSAMQEEMLNSAMDSIAERMYTPLIIAKLGASATDLGTSQPWIPTPDDRDNFTEAMDEALAADFRILTTNFATQVDSLFGRENMPDFSMDFERIQGRLLQTFGLSETMLAGASSGQTYAADALNRDLVSQLLKQYQKLVARHFRQRARVVAEAQEHYDYEERNGKRYVKMEEVLDIDEETGEERIVEQPKLLIPELRFETLSLNDEQTERQFLESLVAAGVPISIKTRMVNIPYDFDEEVEKVKQEAVDRAVAEQETRRETYIALRDAGLPIPADLQADFQPMAQQPGQSPTAATEGQRSPMLGLDPVVETPNMQPSPDDMAADQAAGVAMPGQPAQPVDPTQSGAVPAPDDPNGYPAVPPESNEQRSAMPKASVLWRNARRMRELADVNVKEDESSSGPLTQGPRHIGMRRHVSVSKEDPMSEWANPIIRGDVE